MNLRAVDMGGETFCVSVDSAGSVADVVVKIYEAMWQHLSEDAFEERWISQCLAVVHENGLEMLSPHAALASIPIVDGAQLSFMLRKASDEELIDRLRQSRLRLSRTRTKLLPKALRNVPFTRDMLSRAALALRTGKQVSGFHTLTSRINQLEFQEDNWSWTLLYDHADAGQFVWRHQERGSPAVVVEAWPTDAGFIEFWSQMTEQSSCAFAGLLLYDTRPEAVLLEGTLLCDHFKRLK